MKVVEHRQKLLNHAGRRKLAELVALTLAALARVLKLSLQPGYAIQQLVALRLHRFQLRRPSSPWLLNVPRLGPSFRRLFDRGRSFTLLALGNLQGVQYAQINLLVRRASGVSLPSQACLTSLIN